MPPRPLALAVLIVFALGGCDATEDDLTPPDGGLVVLLVGDELRLETEELVACLAPPLVVDVARAGDVLDLRVRGREPISALQCEGPEQPSEFRTDLSASGETLSVDVRVGEATDRYVVRWTRGGTFLEPVRTSFSRPGPR